MFTLRRAKERRQVLGRKQEVWQTFTRESADPLAVGFGALEALDESRLSAGTSATPHARQEAEIVTYVLQGALAQEDSTGRSGLVQAGEFQRLTTGRRIHYRERNASPVDGAHAFRLSLRPSEPVPERAAEQKLFPVADRKGGLCLIASPDGRKGSLRVRQDTFLYSSILDVGQHLVHELAHGRGAWIQMVSGGATLGGLVLAAGDGVGVTDELAVSLTAREGTELLLLDLGVEPARPPTG